MRLYTADIQNFGLGILRDQPKYDFNDKDAKRYFQNGFEIFLNRLAALRESKREVAAAEQKELKFMLEALLDTKNYLERKKG